MKGCTPAISSAIREWIAACDTFVADEGLHPCYFEDRSGGQRDPRHRVADEGLHPCYFEPSGRRSSPSWAALVADEGLHPCYFEEVGTRQPELARVL